VSDLFDLFNNAGLDALLAPAEPPPPPEPEPEPVRVLLPNPPEKRRMPPPPPPKRKTACKWCQVSSGCRCCEKCGTTTENHHAGCTLAPAPVSKRVTEAQRLTLRERAWQAASMIRPLIAPGTPDAKTEQLVNEMQQIICVEMERGLCAALQERNDG
jgi:hypothetical protein